MQSKWISRGQCPCGESSKGYNIHADGHAFCFSCNKRFNNVGEAKMETGFQKTGEVVDMQNRITSTGDYGGITDRRISEQTARKYRTKIRQDGSMITHHYYEYFNSDGSHVATKVRQVEGKKIWSQGNIGDALLFGQNLFKSGGKYITIVEGEIDAMSVYEMLGSKWAVVSIKNGVQSAVQNCKQHLEYLNSFENVVVCFDTDKPGVEASQKVAQLFEPNKCKIVRLDYKDPNEYLKMGKAKDFVQDWWSAESYTPAGIVNLAKLGDELYEEEYCETIPYPWSAMNEKTYGMRTGELVTFTSGAGMGKSSIMRELMHHILKNSNDNIGILALEESTKNTAFNIMSVEANQRLYIKEIRNQFAREQLNKWQKETIGSGRFFAFDHFGSIGNDEILSRVRYMAKSLDCKWIFLDHLSILVSGQDEGDERKSIDVLMTKLRSLVEETGVGLLLVSHLRRPSGDLGHENGKEVTLSHLRGSASIAHLSDSVIALERNQQSDDEVIACTTTIRILKNRYTGETGVCSYLHYDKKSGRMSQIDNPFEDNFENEAQGVI
jgi:twinkle protein